MKFSMTGQKKSDLLIQVTAWAGLTVHSFSSDFLLAFFMVIVGHGIFNNMQLFCFKLLYEQLMLNIATRGC